MYYMSATAEPVVKGHVWKVTAPLKGISIDKPFKWIVRGQHEKQSVSQGLYPGIIAPVPLESNQGLIGVTCIWVSVGSVPSTDVVGTNITPDFNPGVPENIWSSLSNPVNVYPYGWVLDSREPDIIPGTDCCLVTDQYTYYQRYKPGNG